MSSILDKLKAYYETTSSEQIKKDWEKTTVYDKIYPSVDSYLEQVAYYRELNKNGMKTIIKQENHEDITLPFLYTPLNGVLYVDGDALPSRIIDAIDEVFLNGEVIRTITLIRENINEKRPF